eukprot:1426837-Rhodomonas_salina.1
MSEHCKAVHACPSQRWLFFDADPEGLEGDEQSKQVLAMLEDSEGGCQPALGKGVSDILSPCALAELEELVTDHVVQEVDVSVDVPAVLGIDWVLRHGCRMCCPSRL